MVHGPPARLEKSAVRGSDIVIMYVMGDACRCRFPAVEKLRVLQHSRTEPLSTIPRAGLGQAARPQISERPRLRYGLRIYDKSPNGRHRAPGMPPRRPRRLRGIMKYIPLWDRPAGGREKGALPTNRAKLAMRSTLPGPVRDLGLSVLCVM